jgi:malonyl-CoA/methylmalonyl-CoA synthetase
MSQLTSYPLLARIAARARTAPDAPAIVVPPFEASYARLSADVLRLASRLACADGRTEGLAEARVALLVDKGYLAVLGLLSIWAAGGLAVPVLPSLPIPEQAYLVNTADCALILVDKNNRARAEQLVAQKKEGEALKIMEVAVDELVEEVGDAVEVLEALAQIDGERRAMMLFTSGTTGRPKGAVTRHSSLAAQVESTVEAWRWTEADNLLHILPLNHLHGIAVGLLPTLWAGASVEMWDKFDADKVWARWINADAQRPITMFFFVPTGYCELRLSQPPMSPANASAPHRGPQGNGARAAGRGVRCVRQAPPAGVRLGATARERQGRVGDRHRRRAGHPRAVRDDRDGVDCRHGVGEREARQGESGSGEPPCLPTPSPRTDSRAASASRSPGCRSGCGTLLRMPRSRRATPPATSRCAARR